MKHMILMTFIFVGLNSQASLLKRVQHEESINKKVAVATEEKVVAVSDGSINWTEWESDFNASLKNNKKSESACKGKNCQFKKMQALDPSFEF